MRMIAADRVMQGVKFARMSAMPVVLAISLAGVAGATVATYVEHMRGASRLADLELKLEQERYRNVILSQHSAGLATAQTLLASVPSLESAPGGDGAGDAEDPGAPEPDEAGAADGPMQGRTASTRPGAQGTPEPGTPEPRTAREPDRTAAAPPPARESVRAQPAARAAAAGGAATRAGAQAGQVASAAPAAPAAPAARTAPARAAPPAATSSARAATPAPSRAPSGSATVAAAAATTGATGATGGTAGATPAPIRPPGTPGSRAPGTPLTVNAEQVGVSALEPGVVVMRSGARVAVGQRFEFGETLLKADPATGLVQTDQRTLMIVLGAAGAGQAGQGRRP